MTLTKQRIKILLKFLQEIEKLREVKRQIFYSDGTQENDAEHSWHVAMFVVLFAGEFPELNLEKMLKMALVHDLVEIYAGDSFFYDHQARADKVEREKQAADQLFTQLPNDLKKDFWQLFEEFEAENTQEARVVRSLDRLQPILQNISSNGLTWQKKQITFEMLDSNKRPGMIHDQKILSIYEQLLDEIKAKKLL